MHDYALEFVSSPMPKLKHSGIDMDFLPVYDVCKYNVLKLHNRCTAFDIPPDRVM